jgi:hypothetical protein
MKDDFFLFDVVRQTMYCESLQDRSKKTIMSFNIDKVVFETREQMLNGEEYDRGIIDSIIYIEDKKWDEDEMWKKYEAIDSDYQHCASFNSIEEAKVHREKKEIKLYLESINKSKEKNNTKSELLYQSSLTQNEDFLLNKEYIKQLEDDMVQRAMDQLDFEFAGYKFEDLIEKYTINEDVGMSFRDNETRPFFKRDIKGLYAYFGYFKNMKKLFKALTFATRKGDATEKYLKDVNLMNNEEVKSIAKKGFGDVSLMINDLLNIKNNDELRKDYEACLSVIQILTS